MIDKLLPLIKERFTEPDWNVITSQQTQNTYDVCGRITGSKVMKYITIEHEYSFAEIRIGYDTAHDMLWVGGEDVPYKSLCMIHDIIEEAMHKNKVVRCEKCNAIIDVTDREYYTGIEYFCSACGNSGFIERDKIWTTKK